MTTTLRFDTWVLRAAEDRPAPVRYIACQDCEDTSPVDTQQAPPETWALAHSGRTGHRRYREVVSAELRTCLTSEEGSA
ncbi:hypothetical protein [Streptomyces sp. NPDC058872]|uniref:DUF7848 domain-containing protein n=1 Tax=Streptomyces sp. NPDC058872 TaxID=3346661 RepID=UPI00367B7DD8